jgi:hypothetical protein
VEQEQRRITAKAIRLGEDAANALLIADEAERRIASDPLLRAARELTTDALTADRLLTGRMGTTEL